MFRVNQKNVESSYECSEGLAVVVVVALLLDVAADVSAVPHVHEKRVVFLLLELSMCVCFGVGGRTRREGTFHATFHTFVAFKQKPARLWFKLVFKIQIQMVQKLKTKNGNHAFINFSLTTKVY